MTGLIPPTITIVAGPNGAGKSTFTAALAARLHGHLIDPDAIAREVAPVMSGVAAGREAIRRRDAYLGARRSFAIETTLAGEATLSFMERAAGAGFAVDLVFIGVEDVQTLIDRIRVRVARGGHDVPEGDVRRRYARSLRNLPRAIECATGAMVYDNSLEGDPCHVLTVADGRVVGRASVLPRWVLASLGQLLSPPTIVE